MTIKNILYFIGGISLILLSPALLAAGCIYLLLLSAYYTGKRFSEDFL